MPGQRAGGEEAGWSWSGRDSGQTQESLCSPGRDAGVRRGCPGAAGPIPLRPAFGGAQETGQKRWRGLGGLGPLFLIPSQGCEGPAPP